MINTKRVFVLTKVVGESIATAGMMQDVYADRADAVAAMQAFRNANDPAKEVYFLEPDTICVTGYCHTKKVIEDKDVFENNGNQYLARIAEREVDPSELEVFEREYEVTINITKVFAITKTLRARNEDSASDNALENAINGEYEDDINWNYPDDEDHDIVDCYES